VTINKMSVTLEVEKAITAYKSHHAQECIDDPDVQCDATTATSLEPSACVAAASATVSELQVTLTSAANNIALPSADVLAAIQAMTQAAERLACAADRMEAVNRT
jgi:hypothetical protein